METQMLETRQIEAKVEDKANEQSEIELKAKEAKTVQKAVDGKMASDLLDVSADYVDPISENYISERDNLITANWSLFYEVSKFKDKEHNKRMF